MKIKYLGHSSFLLTESTGTSIVTDPYNHIGYEMPQVKSDVVTVSHNHKGHNNIKHINGTPIVINSEGSYEFEGVEITGVKAFHDDEEGKRYGENIVFKFRMDGLDICHLGDIGEECTSDLVESLLPVNVLMIPVGGNTTIDAESAKDYVDKLMPEIVIPMHFKTKSVDFDIDKVDDFIHLFKNDEIILEGQDVLELSREDLDEETTTIVVMKRNKNEHKK